MSKRIYIYIYIYIYICVCIYIHIHTYQDTLIYTCIEQDIINYVSIGNNFISIDVCVLSDSSEIIPIGNIDVIVINTIDIIPLDISFQLTVDHWRVHLTMNSCVGMKHKDYNFYSVEGKSHWLTAPQVSPSISFFSKLRFDNGKGQGARQTAGQQVERSILHPGQDS